MQNMCRGVLVSCGKLVLHAFLSPTCVQSPCRKQLSDCIATDGTQSFAVILFGKVNYIGPPYIRTIITDGSTTHWVAPYNDNGMQALNDVTLTWSVYPQLN